jgi:hypothetical protein
MDTAFIIGNGESRKIFPIEHLKGKGTIYGCNAIYRDHPWLCDHIVAVNQPMYDEVAEWYAMAKPQGLNIHGPNDISDWNYADGLSDKVPEGLKLYRMWRGAFLWIRHTGCQAVGDARTKQGTEQHIQGQSKLSRTCQHEGIPQV